jgi:hypothetical protein
MTATPRILVLYYTQSGQLRTLIDSILQDITAHAEIDFAPITPQLPFPFPWDTHAFFDAMPETVAHLPAPVNPIREDVYGKEYDLIILGYQPWFLNPSQPITAFLQSAYAKVLENKPVLTVVGCRNMWLHAQEKVKEYLLRRNARLVGNIVLADTHSNIISTLTIIRWAFKGQKEASGWLPAAGVPEKEVRAATRFGKTIWNALLDNDLATLQEKLLRQNAVVLKPGLVLLEQRGIRNFRKWSEFIRAKGGPGDRNRKGRITLFKNLLAVAIFILSPITSFAAFIQLQFHRKKRSEAVAYFKGLQYERGRI